eukprot:GDKI01049299.1.p1 GENE.GDKI01049299.1~~GDKI01049299.1.p1  ORF type:complete len:102 (-),score=16.57 GDKI01049299.1:154-459(-)
MLTIHVHLKATHEFHSATCRVGLGGFEFMGQHLQQHTHTEHTNTLIKEGSLAAKHTRANPFNTCFDWLVFRQFFKMRAQSFPPSPTIASHKKIVDKTHARA